MNITKIRTSCWVVLCIVLLSLALVGQEAPRWTDIVKASQEAYSRGDYAMAEELLKAALKEAEKIGRGDIRYGTTLRFLGEFYEGRGRPREAEPLYQELRAILEKAVGPDDIMVSVPVFGMARVKQAQGSYAEAESLYQRALEITEKAMGPDDPAVAEILSSYARLLRQTGRENEAAQQEARATGILSRSARWVRLTQAAKEAYQEGRPAEAETLLKTALEEARKWGQDDVRYGETLSYLAEVYESEERYEEAESLYREFLVILEKNVGKEDILVSEPLQDLARVKHARKEYKEAEDFYRRLLQLQEKVLGATDPALEETLKEYANLLRETGREHEAKDVRARAREIRSNTPVSPYTRDLHTSELQSYKEATISHLENIKGWQDGCAPALARELCEDFVEEFRDILAREETLLGKERPEVAVTLEALAWLLRQTGEQSEATQLEARAKAIRAKQTQQSPPQ